MTADPQIRASRGTKVTELFASGDQMIIKSPSQKNHLTAGAKLFVAVGEEGDRGGVGLGGVRLGRGDHAVFVAH